MGYLEMLREAQRQSASTSTSTTPTSEPLAEYGLAGVDCPLCENTGRIIQRGPGLLELHVYECPCMKQRRSLRSLRNAGMEDMAKRYTLEAYKPDTQEAAAVKKIAEKYLKAPDGWFFIFGQSGSGKTHICTAICSGLMQRNSELYFMPWRDEVAKLKGQRDVEIEAKIAKLKRVPVLYIDDLFKGGASEADTRIAFEILNARYNNTALRTVISSEMSLEKIMQIDEAIGGRIYERSRGFVVKAPSENWRLR